MRPKIFIACDTTNVKKIKKIIKYSQSSKIKFGYKFGLEFLNSKYGRKFVSSLKTKLFLETISWQIYQILVHLLLKLLKI